MSRTNLATVACLAAVLFLAACGRPPAAGSHPPVPTDISTSPGPATGRTTGTTEGTVVRFSSDATSVDVTIGADTPAVRSFLRMLPLTLTVEEFAGREKIAHLPHRLQHDGSPGSDPEDGDLIYYVPWGNLGFYYNADGVGYSDQTLHLGTYQASREQLELLEGAAVTVEAVT